MNKRKHIIVVEPYEGGIEFLSNQAAERMNAQGIGLPLDEIAAALECEITVLSWEDWYPFEENETWTPIPATRPTKSPRWSTSVPRFKSPDVHRVSIPAQDPESLRSFAEHGLVPRSHGLINDSGLLFFAAYCLNQELLARYYQSSIDAVILPMWGGLGYVAQMARATHAPESLDVPFVVVVTDTSAHRQKANQEGFWNRQAIVRRQMEDVSLALADEVLTFGDRGDEIAICGRLPEAPAPIRAPRFIEPSVILQIANAIHEPRTGDNSIQFFMKEPQQAASGVLNALNAVALLKDRGVQLEHPLISVGRDMVFAPMKPKSFISYWSSRPFAAELVREQQWEWRQELPDMQSQFPIRLFPSLFEHLPDVWTELARGSLILLSEAATEGFAPGELLPRAILIPGNSSPEDIAHSLEKVAAMDMAQLDSIRREVCAQVIAAQDESRARLLAQTVGALSQLLQNMPEPQDLERVAQLFLDRRQSLRNLTSIDAVPDKVFNRTVSPKPATLSVVITCCNLGHLVRQAVVSVWSSERCPEELLLVDDGSQDEETLKTIAELEIVAREKHLPLEVIHQRNSGLASARNTGLARATGEFISFLDGDDLIAPYFYRVALDLLQMHPALGGVAAWAEFFGEGIENGFWNAPQAELPFLLVENSVIVPCVTRTQLLRELGGYDIRQTFNYEDWELVIRMLEAGFPIITVPMHGLRYRVRSNSLYRSMNEVQDQVMKEQLFKMHRELMAHFAAEVAAQLESRWMSLRYPDEHMGANADVQNYYSHPKPTLAPSTPAWLSKPLQILLSIRTSVL
ncbi:MAG: glycosyltransferase family 2 protein [Chloroflexi bacterium]|nr:glycosyltransferase family 2 protein [Chloroflexota bacterium]